MIENCYFGEVPASHVEPEKVKLAAEVLDFCYRHYGGGEVKLRWLKKDKFAHGLARIEEALKWLSGSKPSHLERGYMEDEAGLQGLVRMRLVGGEKSSIFLVTETPADKVGFTTAHEFYHSRFSTLCLTPEQRAADDSQADKFAERALREMAAEKAKEDHEQWMKRYRELNSRR